MPVAKPKNAGNHGCRVLKVTPEGSPFFAIARGLSRWPDAIVGFCMVMNAVQRGQFGKAAWLEHSVAKA
jgi:hypothetical protein